MNIVIFPLYHSYVFGWIIQVKMTPMKSMLGIRESIFPQYEKRWQRMQAKAVDKTMGKTGAKRILHLQRIMVTQKGKRRFWFEIWRILRVVRDLKRLVSHGKHNETKRELCK